MVGETLGGQYHVLRKLGSGGMGIVYLAEEIPLERYVAIKVLRPEVSGNPDLVARFFQEAKTTASFKHPGIVAIHNAATLPDGRSYLVMEYLEGKNLAEHLAAVGPLAVPDAIELARQIASGVALAHDQGIIHRDLKPANIFLTTDPERGQVRVKILDFGIAKLIRKDGAVRGPRTQTGIVLGTPQYMAPEQCRGSGSPIDRRADVYALGCIFYAMLTGRPPFLAVAIGDVIAAHLRESIKPLRDLRADVPGPVAALVAQMLAMAREDRPATMQNVISAIEKFAAPSLAPPTIRLNPTSGAVPPTEILGPPNTRLDPAGEALLPTAIAPPEAPAQPQFAAQPGDTRRLAPTPNFGSGQPETPQPPAAPESQADSVSRRRFWGGILVGLLAAAAAVALFFMLAEQGAKVVLVSPPPPTPPAPERSSPPKPLESEPAMVVKARPAETEKPAPARRVQRPAPRPDRVKISVRNVPTDVTNLTVKVGEKGEQQTLVTNLTVKVGEKGEQQTLPLELEKDGKVYELTFESSEYRAESHSVKADRARPITLINRPRAVGPE